MSEAALTQAMAYAALKRTLTMGHWWLAIILNVLPKRGDGKMEFSEAAALLKELFDKNTIKAAGVYNHGRINALVKFYYLATYVPAAKGIDRVLVDGKLVAMNAMLEAMTEVTRQLAPDAGRGPRSPRASARPASATGKCPARGECTSARRCRAGRAGRRWAWRAATWAAPSRAAAPRGRNRGYCAPSSTGTVT